MLERFLCENRETRDNDSSLFRTENWSTLFCLKDLYHINDMLAEKDYILRRIPKPTGATGKLNIYNRDLLLAHKYTEVEINPETNTPALKHMQMNHVEKLHKILTEIWFAYQDSSGTGCGKTFVSLEVARRLGIPILLIGYGSTVLKKWCELACLFNVPVIDAISYDSLGGQKGRDPKHLLLKRVDVSSGTYFLPTNILEFYAKNGMMVIFDETQKAKNPNSTRGKAARTIAKYVTSIASSQGVMSRVACLSASPGHKEGECASLAKLLGIMSKDRVFFWNIGSKEMELHGFEEVQALAKLFDEEKTAEILSRSDLRTKKDINARLIDLFSEVIKDKIGAAMSLKDEGMNMIEAADYANGFYRAGDNQEKISKQISLLTDATGFDGTGVNMGSGAMARAQAIFGFLEELKTPIMIRQARKKLEADPKCQVVLFVNRLSTVDNLESALSDFKPLLMTGKICGKKRGENLAKFQSPDSEYRLIISTVTTGSVGLDYDDKYGDRVRYMFLFPGYLFIDLFQATGRVNRLSTKSRAIIRFIWAKMGNRNGYDMELKIMDAMARSCDNARKLMAGTSEIPFPGEYRHLVEEEE